MSYHHMKYHTSHIMSYHFIVIISTVIIIMIIIIIVTMVSYRVILYHIIMHTDGDVRHRIFTLDSVSCRLTKISQVPWWRHLAAGRTHSVAEEVPNPGCQTNIYIYIYIIFFGMSQKRRGQRWSKTRSLVDFTLSITKYTKISQKSANTPGEILGHFSAEGPQLRNGNREVLLHRCHWCPQHAKAATSTVPNTIIYTIEILHLWCFCGWSDVHPTFLII